MHSQTYYRVRTVVRWIVATLIVLVLVFGAATIVGFLFGPEGLS